VVGGWSLLAVQRVVEVNRAIITRSIPSLQLESTLTESMAALVRLETRYEILRDQRYQDLWNARADQTAEGLARLGELVGLSERKRLDKVMTAFTRYRERAAAEAGASTAAARTQRSLAQLQQATGQALKRAQLAARHLERRTWRTVMLVLPLSLLALLAGTVALSLRMTRALARLSTATREVVDGSFREPLVVRGKDEIGDLGRMRGDAERLLQVLVNLVGNAIKYTPNGGSVVVVVGEQRDRVEIAVEDTGVGIPADLLPRIFERFWQADPARGGSGLGLTIVKGVVEAHGGQVQVESAEGRGTRFTVHLPREAAAA